jgi:glutamate formiminotransferase / 5-formyltetrahydrofolate cyclo-ligase
LYLAGTSSRTKDVMPDLVQCVPNFSEGRDRDILEAIVAAARAVPAVKVVDWSGDPDHHRMVMTLVGPAAAARDAAFAAAAEAVRRIDLTRHSGQHPRLGAVDVVPFVPLGPTSMEQCIRAAREFGARVASELELPVYFYEEAATRPERRNLSLVRGAGFDALRTVPLTAERAPDLGPPHVHPTAGAVAVGARGRLLAFNVNLRTDDIEIARAIARAIRERDGGLRGVRALGLRLPSRSHTQVSINVTEPDRVPLYRVLELVRAEARRWEVPISGTELIGALSLADLIETARYTLGLHNLRETQVLDIWLPRDGAMRDE